MFTVLTNGIDSDIEIIKHDKTGFYNITKAAKMISDLRNKRSSKSKNIDHYFKLETSIELIEECKQYTKLDEIHYNLSVDTPKQFAGTYVHKLIYDHFLIWLDSKYAMKISIILDGIHQKANRKLLEEKDSIIMEMRKYTAEARQNAEESRKSIEELKNMNTKQFNKIKKVSKKQTATLNELAETKSDLQDINFQNSKLEDKIDKVRAVCKDRNNNYVINPKSKTKLEYFACFQDPVNNNHLYITRGQLAQIKKQRKDHKNWPEVITATIDPNAVNMYNLFKDDVHNYIKKLKDDLKIKKNNKTISISDHTCQLKEIVENPIIKINVNDITFDTKKISSQEILNMINTASAKRFLLSIP